MLPEGGAAALDPGPGGGVAAEDLAWACRGRADEEEVRHRLPSRMAWPPALPWPALTMDMVCGVLSCRQLHPIDDEPRVPLRARAEKSPHSSVSLAETACGM